MMNDNVMMNDNDEYEMIMMNMKLSVLLVTVRRKVQPGGECCITNENPSPNMCSEFVRYTDNKARVHWEVTTIDNKYWD